MREKETEEMGTPKSEITRNAQLPNLLPQRVAPVDSAWHTVVVLLVQLGFSLAGALNRNLSPLGWSRSRAAGYIFVIVFEWIIVAYIWFALKRRGISMRQLISGRWSSAKEILRDLGIGLSFFLLVGGGMVGGLGHFIKAPPNEAFRHMIPQSATELVLWIVLSATAGFCEEVIFRGYFQRQFSALTGSIAGGIVLQGIVFGLSHGYQGGIFVLLLALYGTMFGLLAHWRRSLRPGMLAHFMQDAIGGVAGHLMH